MYQLVLRVPGSLPVLPSRAAALSSRITRRPFSGSDLNIADGNGKAQAIRHLPQLLLHVA